MERPRRRRACSCRGASPPAAPDLHAIDATPARWQHYLTVDLRQDYSGDPTATVLVRQGHRRRAATIAQGWDAALAALSRSSRSRRSSRGRRAVRVGGPGVAGRPRVALVGLGPKDKALELRRPGQSRRGHRSKEKASSVGAGRRRDQRRADLGAVGQSRSTFEGCYVDDRFRTGDNVKNPKLTRWNWSTSP